MNAQKFYEILLHANESLTRNKEYLNSLNVFPVPDGDTGTNMAATFNEAVKSINITIESSISDIANQLAKGALMGARGNSGVILSQILRGFSKGLTDINEITVDSFHSALNAAKESSYKAVMKPKEGTILSVIRAASESADKNAELTDITEYIDCVVKDANIMLEETRNMLPQNQAAGTVDAGGAGLVIILQAFSDTLHNRVEHISFNFNKKDINIDFGNEFTDEHPVGDDITFQYCTEFIIKAGVDEDEFRALLSEIGDCVVVVSMDDITKVHVHTNEPGTALNYAVKYGDITKIKIDNMKEQSEGNIYRKEESSVTDNKVNQAVIAVASGEGIVNMFKDYGVDYVISGGQSMNPSVEEIAKAIKSVNAENVIILPNNKNIILSATQAAELAECNVRVVKTTTIPQGLAAVLNYTCDNTLDNNFEQMNSSLSEVISCQVTSAVRDTIINGLNIATNDTLGIIEDSIECKGTTYLDVLEQLLDKTIDSEKSVVTIIYGSEIREDFISDLEQTLPDKYPDIEFAFVSGEQDIYPFILSVE